MAHRVYNSDLMGPDFCDIMAILVCVIILYVVFQVTKLYQHIAYMLVSKEQMTAYKTVY